MEPRLNLVRHGGRGRPLMLVHGMGAHTGWWDDAGRRLARSAMPVALDLSGHGDSEWREDGAYTTGTWVGDLERARRELGWERFTLVAHSLGARLALEYAAEHPQTLDALVVIDFLTGLGGGRFSTPRHVPQPHYRTEEEALERFRLRPGGTALSAERLRELGRRSLRETPRGWTWKYDFRAFRYSYAPIWDVLPRVKARTLVVRGGESQLMTGDLLRRVSEGLGGARTADIPGAHHHVSLDAPEALAVALESFLA